MTDESAEVLIAVKRGEGYEDVCDELVADDAMAGTCFQWRLAQHPDTPPASAQPVAWIDPDGSRVITAKVKADESQAYRTATAGFTVPLYFSPPSDSGLRRALLALLAEWAAMDEHYSDPDLYARDVRKLLAPSVGPSAEVSP
jgi:hypothetical protein